MKESEIMPIQEEYRGMSIIVPTYKENENIEILCKSIFSALEKGNTWGELLIIDDNSKDGSRETVKKLIEQG